ncbi:hypothetical protein [Pseudomonas phage D6]|nr:hypothetical protein [Pseudomonas phage D6]
MEKFSFALLLVSIPLSIALIAAIIGIGTWYQDNKMNQSPKLGMNGRYMIRFRYRYFKGLETRWKHEYLAFVDPQGQHQSSPDSVWMMNEYMRFSCVFDTYSDAKSTFEFYDCGTLKKMEKQHNWKAGPITVELLEERKYFGFFKSWYTLHSVEMK